MLVLKDLWKGEITPGEGQYYPNPEYSKAVQIMERCDDVLKKQLAQEDYKIFREYADAALSASCTESCDNFINGFRLGALIMMDVLTDCRS